jgi:hypothetical protein
MNPQLYRWAVIAETLVYCPVRNVTHEQAGESG